jgi:hypothetical protein
MLLLPAALLLTSVPPPNPIYDASKFAKPVATVTNGVRTLVSVPDAVPLPVVHLFGTPAERGEAYGRLFSAEMLFFLNTAMPDFFRQYVDSLRDEIHKLPKWLQEAILAVLPVAEKAAPVAFDLALTWLEGLQRSHNNASAAHVYEEIRGMAHGICAAAPVDVACDEASLAKSIARLKVLPDLIKMQCSMMAARGAATPGGHLTQLRTLDFGGGPFANNSLLLVHHPTGAKPFASLSFPGFVGVVTGFSPTVSLSEKVNDLDGGGTPPGSYDGQATAYVIRDILQFSTTKEDAHAIASKAARTWGVWLGVGDVSSQNFLAIEYMRASAKAYNSSTLPALTGQEAIPSVAFIDKHPQPSTRDLAMPTAIKASYGNLSAAAVAQQIPRATGSGDVHIAVYDYTPGSQNVLLSIGSTDVNGTYDGPGGRKACYAPFVRFDAAALWKVQKPSASEPTKHKAGGTVG